MKKETISLTLGNIDSRFIEEAELYSADKKQGKSLKNVWRRAAIARGSGALRCLNRDSGCRRDL